MARTRRKTKAVKSDREVFVPRQGVTEYSGSGFHTPRKYGKNDRRKAKAELREYY